MRSRLSALLVTGLLAAGAVIVGCSDVDSSGATTAGTATAVADAAPADLERWQSDLNAVGCYAGPVDGALGPETEAAIRQFQEAAGIAVDGQLGPQTEGALQEAVSAGDTVCTSGEGGSTTGTTTTTATTPTDEDTTISSSSYDRSFSVDSCAFSAVDSDLTVSGTSGELTLLIDVNGGTGTIAVSGGDESDGIDLNGTVDSLEAGPDDMYTLAGD